MASPDPPPCARDVRIAVICALKLEYDAVKLTFEHIWEADKTQDGYGYSTGRIGGHVSLLVSCEAGKASAAGAASSIRSRYRGVKLAIVAGICGGVPGVGTKKELRLGDVVVSTSIFQYDYGRRNTDRFRAKEGIEDALPVPGPDFRSFLSMLQTRDAQKQLQSKTCQILQEIQCAEPKKYKRPEDAEDYLYQADYVHKHRTSPHCDCDESAVCDKALEATCEKLGCEDSFVVQRPCREHDIGGGESSSTAGSPDTRIYVRFGCVGSGDTVMKSGRDRDDMAKNHNLIALEMEGAAVRKHINDSIVVKSVCDYADSHKNKNWQDFAAAAAASVTKALLERFSCEEEPETPTFVRSLTDKGHFKGKYDQLERQLLPLLAAEHERYKDFNPEKVEGTCEWFFKDHRFLEWLDSPSSIIWVSAGPGCGKSVLAKALIDERRLSKTPEETTVCYFFFKAGEERRTGSSDAISAVLHQLFYAKRGSELIQYAKDPFTSYREKLRDNFHRLWDILTNCARSPGAGEIVCVLDALDECDETGRQEIFMKLRTFDKAQSRLKFLITGRPYDHLEDEFKGLSKNGLCIQLDGDDKSKEIHEEINLVIDHKVNTIAEHWEHFGVEHRQQLLERLKEMENRTYLWLHLTMSIIEKRRSRYSKFSSIKRLLEQLPLDAFEAYEKILNHSQDEIKARCLLQIILAATQPLTLEELNHCFALQEERFGNDVSYTYNDLRAELEPSATFASTVRNLCGLFLSIHDGKVSFIHKTARDFLFTEPESQTGVWQGKFRLTLAHNVMFVSCGRLISLEDFDVLAEGIIAEDRPWVNLLLEANRVLPFMSYAVSHWTYHYNSQDEEDKNRFLKVDVNEHGGYHGTAVKCAAFLGHVRLFRTLCQHGADCDAAGGQFRTALEAALFYGRLEVIKCLLDESPGAHVTQEVIAVAAQGFGASKEMMSFLLDKCPDFEITQEIVLNVVARGRPEVIRLILERYRDMVQITPKVMIFAADSPHGDGVLRFLFENCGDKVEITPDLLRSAAGSSSSAKEKTAFLLEKGSAENLEHMGAILDAAARNRYAGDGVFTILLEKYGDFVEITPSILCTAARWGSHETMTLLLEKRGDKIQVTQEVILAIVGNEYARVGMVALLIEKGREAVRITQRVLTAAAETGPASTIDFLLQRYSNEFELTEYAIRAAKRNRFHAVEIIYLFSEHYGDRKEFKALLSGHCKDKE